MYDISGFADWLNEDKSKRSRPTPFEKLGLRDGAPPEAIKAFKEFCDAQKWADENHILL